VEKDIFHYTTEH